MACILFALYRASIASTTRSPCIWTTGIGLLKPRHANRISGAENAIYRPSNETESFRGTFTCRRILPDRRSILAMKSSAGWPDGGPEVADDEADDG